MVIAKIEVRNHTTNEITIQECKCTKGCQPRVDACEEYGYAPVEVIEDRVEEVEDVVEEEEEDESD